MHFYPHFMDENTEANGHRNLLKVTYVTKSNVKIVTHLWVNPKPILLTQKYTLN